MSLLQAGVATLPEKRRVSLIRIATFATDTFNYVTIKYVVETYM